MILFNQFVVDYLVCFETNRNQVSTEPTYADPHGFKLHPVSKKPHNPFRDSGALALISLLQSKIKTEKTMYSYLVKFIQKLAGNWYSKIFVHQNL